MTAFNSHLHQVAQKPLPFNHELYVDLFAGAGGASSGGARAYRDPDVAINHNPLAIAVHRANHPNTRHYISDVFEVDPLEATGGQPVGILWASPDCRHFSRAKGAAPRSKRVRMLAWVIVHWVYVTRPRLLFMENVPEFTTWGPLDEAGRPIKELSGRTFDAFVACLSTGLAADHPDFPEIMEAVGQWVPKEALVHGLGVNFEHRIRRASNTGAPTIRTRWFGIGRTDGRQVVWPAPTHHEEPKGGQQPWRQAAECIDFSNLGTSITDERQVHNTNVRVAKGFWRHTVMAEQPFTVPLDDQALAAAHLTEFANASSQRTFAANEPLRTQVANIKGGHFAVAAAHLAKPQQQVTAAMVTLRKGSVGSTMLSPINTATTSSGHHALAACHFEQANGGFYQGDGRAASAPVSTICGKSNQRLATAYLIKYYGTGGQWQSCNEPAHTLPTKARLGLVTVHQVPADLLPPHLIVKAKLCARFLHKYLSEHFPEPVDLVVLGDYVLVDISLRMLKPQELKLAQGFALDYIIDRGLFINETTGQLEWKPLTIAQQIKLIGNSVCPTEAEALIAANDADMIELYRKEAA
ncbi:DNA cytosine methyltransferase [Pseudomonas sp. D2-3]